MSTSLLQNAMNQLMDLAVAAPWSQFDINSVLLRGDESLRSNLANLTPVQREHIGRATMRVARTIKETDAATEGQPA